VSELIPAHRRHICARFPMTYRFLRAVAARGASRRSVPNRVRSRDSSARAGTVPCPRRTSRRAAVALPAWQPSIFRRSPKAGRFAISGSAREVDEHEYRLRRGLATQRIYGSSDHVRRERTCLRSGRSCRGRANRAAHLPTRSPGDQKANVGLMRECGRGSQPAPMRVINA
jgi:hypothetical protein